MRSDRPAPFKPAKTYPEWAYDAPSYTRPVDEPKAEPKSRAKDPDHYFTSKPVIMVHQPEGYVAEEIPRVAVWYTRDNGHQWKKAGYFGRSATYFPLQVKKEGDYGIRFVGPGQEAAMEAPPNPVCVHHVDMTPPKVALSIDPEQAWYTLGQRVTVNWTATDPHLEAMPARVSVITDWASDQARPIEIAREQPEAGSVDYTIPTNLMGDGFRIRVDAIDRAGNIGMAYSQTLQIEPDRMDGGTKPPVRVINHDENTPSVDSPVSTDPAPITVEKSPTQTVSTPTSPVPVSGEMLPLEEIPVSGSATPVKDATQAPRIETPANPSALQMDDQAQATPIAPTGGTTAATSPNTSKIEPLQLLPMTETPVQNSSASNSTPIEPKQPAVSPPDDQTIVSDSPAVDVAPTEASQSDSEYVEEESVIKPVSVTPVPVEDQPQASQNHDVECDSIDESGGSNDANDGDDVAPETEEVDDEEASAGHVSEWQASVPTEVDDATRETAGSILGRKLASGLRAAEAAVEHLLAGVKGSSGVTAADVVRGADVMVGGGLAAPMPATVFSMVKAPSTELPHAWRTLATRATRRGHVWTLPRPALTFELPRLFAREAPGASRSRGEVSAENSAARGSRIQAVAVSSDPD